MVDQAFQAEITLYASCGGAKWVELIQTRLEALDAGYSLPRRQWLPDIRKTAWTWRATFFGPAEWEEETEA